MIRLLIAPILIAVSWKIVSMLWALEFRVIDGLPDFPELADDAQVEQAEPNLSKAA